MRAVSVAMISLWTVWSSAAEDAWVSDGSVSAGSVYEPNTRGNVFDGGRWCGAQEGEDWIQLDFAEPETVIGLSIFRAGTDITTDGGRIVVKFRKPDGDWVVVDELQETNINYDELSFGNRGHSIPTYAKEFEPLLAIACRLELFGHGWFRAQDIQIRRQGVASPGGDAGKSGGGSDGDPLSIELVYDQGATHAEWGRTKLTVHSSGAAEVERSGERFCDQAVTHSFQLTRDELRRIAEALRENGFFALDEHYWDPDVMDGWSAVLRVQLDGREHTVGVMNTSPDEFDAITDVLEGLISAHVPAPAH